jgi:hypothetical protein
MAENKDILFEVMTLLGFRVRVTQIYWNLIVSVKHPVMAGREGDVRSALENPDEIRQSKSDEDVYLFYKAEREKKWICAVSKQTGESGFLIATYPTDAIRKEYRYGTSKSLLR